MSGSVTRRKTVRRFAPRLRAASSSRWFIERSPDSTVITKNGMATNDSATNDSATMTPARVNGSEIPNALSSGSPMNPRRPWGSSSAIPPATGGSTIGSVVSPRTSPLPRKLLRARIQASGNPNSSAMTMLASEAMMESPSASSELLFVMMPKTLPHGAPVIIPISGNTKNSAASAARQASGLNGCFCWSIPVRPAAGTRSWPARPGPGVRARS
jgi:hypothetical protein